MREETVEHAMREHQRIPHHVTQLCDPYLDTNNPLKALELWEVWKAKLDLITTAAHISHQCSACSTTTNIQQHTYDQTIYTNSSSANGTAVGERLLGYRGHAHNPAIHHAHAIPSGTWRWSFQAKMKAIKKALQIIQTEEYPQKVRTVSDSQSVLLRIVNLQPAITLKSTDESDILNLHATLQEEGHQITFTWCPSHCGVVGN